MSTYTTQSKVLLTLPSVGSVSTVGSADIAHYMDRVDNVINAKLSKRYTIPVSGAPILETIATDLTVYELLAKRIFVRNTSKDSPWLKEYKIAMDLLNEISEGKIELFDSSGATISAKSTGAGSVWSNNSGYTPTFQEDQFENQTIDSDKLDDIEDDRK